MAHTDFVEYRRERPMTRVGETDRAYHVEDQRAKVGTGLLTDGFRDLIAATITDLSSAWSPEAIEGAARRIAVQCMDKGELVDGVKFRSEDYEMDEVTGEPTDKPLFPVQMAKAQEIAKRRVELWGKKERLTPDEYQEAMAFNDEVSEKGAGCTLLVRANPDRISRMFDGSGSKFTEMGKDLVRVDVPEGFFKFEGGFCYVSSCSSASDVITGELRLNGRLVVRAQGLGGEVWQDAGRTWDGMDREEAEAA